MPPWIDKVSQFFLGLAQNANPFALVYRSLKKSELTKGDYANLNFECTMAIFVIVCVVIEGICRYHKFSLGIPIGWMIACTLVFFFLCFGYSLVRSKLDA